MGSAEVILIDTHVLLWWTDGKKGALSAAARKAIDAELDGGEILVSSVSAWEIALLAAKGRLGLPSDVLGWLEIVDEIEAVRFVPLDNEIAIRSTQLGDEFHRDPADRFIVATALTHNASLVTADEKIQRYPHVKTIW